MHYLRRCSAARHPATVARLLRSTARLKAAYRRVGHYAVATPYMKGLLIQNGFESGRIAILPPYFARPDEMRPYCPPSGPDTLLYVGRLELEKGVPYLLKALALMPRGVDLMIAGDGTQRAQYERLAEQLGLAARVKFLGWCPSAEVTQRYREAAITVMPSICPEAFGRAGVESFAQGRPVAAFRVGGIPDWLTEGETGLLAEPADAAGLAACLDELLASPDRTRAMGLTARGLVAERYNAHEHLIGVERLLNGARHA
jgi:glycosyltransferase involved in cell wall biosynthesis